MIVQNLIRLPHGFRLLTRKLFSRVEHRFQGHGAVVIRGFVFLRLICPALINPHDYYLLVSASSDAPVCLALSFDVISWLHHVLSFVVLNLS